MDIDYPSLTPLRSQPHTQSQLATTPRSVADFLSTVSPSKRPRSNLSSPSSPRGECQSPSWSPSQLRVLLATAEAPNTPPSPSYRNRKRTRPQEMSEVAPSYVRSYEEALSFDPGEYLGIFAYMPESSVSFRVSAFSLLRQSSGPKILAFYGQGNDSHIHVLSCDLAGLLRQEFDATVYAVSATPPEDENPYGIPIVYDPKTNLIRYCRALDPIAGGKHAMNAVVVVDSFEKRRMFLPVGYGGHLHRPVAVENLDWVIGDALRYLRYEQTKLAGQKTDRCEY